MHFLETYLASILYVSIPFGIVTSPGSTVLFTGKLMILLLLYIREDAVVVRQPIYGLLFGNVLLFALAYHMRQHTSVTLTPGRTADFTFLNEQLARHYGIGGIYGTHFRRVTLGDENRWGLLGKGAVLAVTSYTT